MVIRFHCQTYLVFDFFFRLFFFRSLVDQKVLVGREQLDNASAVSVRRPDDLRALCVNHGEETSGKKKTSGTN